MSIVEPLTESRIEGLAYRLWGKIMPGRYLTFS